MTQPIPSEPVSWILIMIATAGSSCSDSTGPDEILALSVTPSDTVLFAGEPATFNALAEYEWGVYPADSVAWSVSDIGVLRILEVEDATALVTVDARGEAFLIATLGELVDSARVIAVAPGDLRWRALVGGDGGLALDGAGRVYVADRGSGGHRLTAVTGEGQIVFSVPSGWSFLSPSVTPDGYSYVTSGLGTTGIRTERRSPDATLEWTVPFGSFDGGAAVAPDGSVAIVDVIAEGEFPTVVTKISSEGVEIWRDTLALTPDMDAQSSAPAIATNGDIYVPWAEQIFGPNWVSRVSGGGELVWTVPGTGWAFSTSPALSGDRVIVTGRGGTSRSTTLRECSSGAARGIRPSEESLHLWWTRKGIFTSSPRRHW